MPEQWWVSALLRERTGRLYGVCDGPFSSCEEAERHVPAGGAAGLLGTQVHAEGDHDCLEHALEVAYGLPAPELIEQARQGLVALGGCIPGGPEHRCGVCGLEW